jgi:hypothetical protein
MPLLPAFTYHTCTPTTANRDTSFRQNTAPSFRFHGACRRNSAKMSTQQQALIMETILGLKRASKRKAYGAFALFPACALVACLLTAMICLQNPTPTHQSTKTRTAATS